MIRKRVVVSICMLMLILGGDCIGKGSGTYLYADEQNLNDNILPLASTTYAYSIGVNHGTQNSGYTGDFTPNVIYAKNAYDNLNNVSSIQILQPTKQTLLSSNPNGNRILASKIVFLNGHATPTQMIFNHNNAGGNYYALVTSSYDGSNGAGLLSINMSTCKLISFVGCQTGNLSYSNNLVRTAVAQGAKVAVGFKEDISSRTTAGRGWVNKYNEALGNGKTVSASIRAAVDSYPNSTLSTYVILAGNPSNAVGTLSVGEEVMSSIETVKPSYYANIDISQLPDIVEDDVTKACYKNIVSRVKKINDDFNPDDYKISINRYDIDSKSGTAILLYYINGEIKTTRAYTCTIEDDVITEIRAINHNTSGAAVAAATRTTVLSEKQIMNLVHDYKETQEENAIMSYNTETYTTVIQHDKCTVDEESIYKVSKDFTYDYTTNSLLYERVVYYQNEDEGGVIGSYCYSEVLY